MNNIAIFLDDERNPREVELRTKWKDYIEPKYYGFSLGEPTPAVWLDVLDEFLDYIVSVHPNFKILQLKIKYGQICIYLDNISPDIQELISDLEDLLQDEYLIY